jgi:hypothetical protein
MALGLTSDNLGDSRGAEKRVKLELGSLQPYARQAVYVKCKIYPIYGICVPDTRRALEEGRGRL